MSYTTSAINSIFQPITKVFVNGLPFWKAVHKQNNINHASGSIQVALFPSGKVIEVNADKVVWHDTLDGSIAVDEIEMYIHDEFAEQQFFRSYTILCDGQVMDDFGPLTLEHAEAMAGQLRHSNATRFGPASWAEPACNYSVVESDLAFDAMPMDEEELEYFLKESEKCYPVESAILATSDPDTHR